MKITSEAFLDGKQMPTRFTCDGEDIHPPFSFYDPPRETKSFCIVMDDLSAIDTDGMNFLHWSIWNIDPEIRSLDAGEIPSGAIQGRTSFGNYHYSGPSPQDGRVHTYRIRLFALDKELDASPNSSMEELEEEMIGHILDEAEIFCTYDRDGKPLWKRKQAEEMEKPESTRMTEEELELVFGGYGEDAE